MRSLVIGAAGNVGRPLCSYLRFLGDDVLEVDIKQGWRDGYLVADINQPLDLLEAFDWKPDVVYLLAAMVSRVTCEQAGGLANQTNLSGVFNVAKLCERSDAKLVFLSTSEVYGPNVDPMDERLANPAPNNRYGLSKWLAEQMIGYEVKHHDLDAVILRPFMIYGENEEQGDHRSAMIRFATALEQRQPVTVHEGAIRGWLHISDAVILIEQAAHLTDFATINIGHPDFRSIGALARLICDELGRPSELVRYAALPPKMTLRKRPSLQLQQTLLGHEPLVGFEAGVRRICEAVVRRADASRLAFAAGVKE